jgi:hypothetical protein
MAVLVHNRGADWSQDLYEATLARVMPDRSRPPAGLLAHVGAPGADGGWQVIDVWESEEAYRRFVEETLFPVAKDLGAPPFESTMVEVHNLLIP